MISQFRSDDFLSVGTAISSHHNIHRGIMCYIDIFIGSQNSASLSLSSISSHVPSKLIFQNIQQNKNSSTIKILVHENVENITFSWTKIFYFSLREILDFLFLMDSHQVKLTGNMNR